MSSMQTLTINGTIFNVTDTTAQQHMQNKENPHETDSEQTGAAPAGYGLGEIAGTVNDLSALKVSGWWEYAYNAIDNPFNGFGGVVLVSASPAITEQKAVTGFGGCTAKRHLSYGDTEYSEWEWDNPPMFPGVEYRTTKRHDGKPVYVRVVEIGALPNASYMAVEELATYVDKLVDANLVVLSLDGSANWINIESELSWYVGNYGTPYAAITTHTDMSSRKARITIEYTKTTD